MGLQTPRGFWYPEGTDPITDYPALAALLAAEIEDEFDNARSVSVRQKSGFNNAAFTYVTLDTGLVEEWAPAGGGFTPGGGSWFTAPDAGKYEVGCYLFWAGATGSGSFGCRIDRYNPAGSVLIDWITGQDSPIINSYLSAWGITHLDAGDRLYFGAYNSASGSAGTLQVRGFVRKV